MNHRHRKSPTTPCFLIGLGTAIVMFATEPYSHANSADDQAARDTAQHFLNLLDSGNYKQAYAALTPRRQATLGEDSVVGFARARRMPLGRARSRSLLESKRTRVLIGNPNGEYEDVAFKTSFEHKVEAVERVVLTKETGTWQVLAYKIY